MDRRLGILLLALAVVAVPAVALRAGCVGAACPPPARAPSALPFCGLPQEHRGLVASGYREGRSPDVVGSTSSGSVLSTPSDDGRVPWPATAEGSTRVPVVFVGTGVRPGPLPPGTSIDQVAPTIANALGFTRPFPEVRSGRPVVGVSAEHGAPLGVVVVWSGVGTSDLERVPAAWPRLRRTMRRAAGTTVATTGSIPVDPVAGIATIGIGATPSLHGVVGAAVRDDAGRVVPAAGPQAPTPVLATLAEDLDEGSGQGASIGLVGGARTDRVLIGGSWYMDGDRDDVDLRAPDPIVAVRRLLARGYGSDGPADLIGVVLHGTVREMDEDTAGILTSVRRAVPGAVLAVAGTGSLTPSTPSMSAAEVTQWIDGLAGAEVVEAVGSGGVFLDRAASASAGVGADQVASMLRDAGSTPGEPVLADAYPGFAVTLAGYC